MFSTTLNLFGLFALLSLCFSLVIMTVFVVHNNWSLLPNRMLFFCMLSFAVACFLTFAIYDSAPGPGRGLVLVMSGATLLIMPFSFLYLQKWPEGTWRITDYLHFMPVGAYLIIGFAGMSGMEFANIEETSNVGIGRLNNLFRIPQGLVYSVLIIYASRRLAARATQSVFAKCPAWLNVFTGGFAIT